MSWEDLRNVWSVVGSSSQWQGVWIDRVCDWESVCPSLTAGQLLTSWVFNGTRLRVWGRKSDGRPLRRSSLLQVCSAVVLDQVSFVLVPLLAARDERERAVLGWPLFIGIGALFTLVTLLLYAVAPYLVPVMTLGFADSTAVLAVEPGKSSTVGIARGRLLHEVLCPSGQEPVSWPSGSGVDCHDPWLVDL